MRAQTLRIGSLRASSLATELLGIVTIGYGFLVDIPWPEKILSALVVTLFLSLSDRTAENSRALTASALEYLEPNLKKQIWFDNLAMHFALDELLNQSRVGSPLKIDWAEAYKHAAEDINRAAEMQKWQEVLLPEKSDEPGFFIAIAVIPLLMLMRGGGGYILAWLAKTYAPQLINYVM